MLLLARPIVARHPSSPEEPPSTSHDILEPVVPRHSVPAVEMDQYTRNRLRLLRLIEESYYLDFGYLFDEDDEDEEEYTYWADEGKFSCWTDEDDFDHPQEVYDGSYFLEAVDADDPAAPLQTSFADPESDMDYYEGS